MKVGFTPHEVRRMAKGLTAEAYRFFGETMPPELTFHVRTIREKRNNASYAFTTFMSNPWLRMEWPDEIVVNANCLPLLYQDEMIGVILHEAAHAIAGLAAQHGREWQEISRALGGHDRVSLLSRNHDKWLEARGASEWAVNEARIALKVGVYQPDYEQGLY